MGAGRLAGCHLIGIYLHVPFCARRCDYCDFFVVVGPPAEAADGGGFFDWLDRDLTLGARALGDPPPRADTVYFGGGTPSYVEPGAIARCLEAVDRTFGIQPGAEITLEANPESVAPERVRAWLDAGVNRLSLGVQSFDDAVLPRRGRLYDAQRAIDAFRTARAEGVENLSVDLIAGLPGETLESFARGLRRLIALSPDHVSVYLIETADALKETPLARAVSEGRERLAEDETLVAMYDEAARRLGEAGYGRYEISNFAREGRVSRHNLKYWRCDDYLGVGPSAHSLVAGRRFGRPSDMARWIEQVRSGLFAPAGDDYTLDSPAARAKEALVLGLRLAEGVALQPFARAWGFDPEASLGRAFDELEEAGLLRRAGGRLALTERGILLSNEVFARLT